jgi:hypothetical protein
MLELAELRGNFFEIYIGGIVRKQTRYNPEKGVTKAFCTY